MADAPENPAGSLKDFLAKKSSPTPAAVAPAPSNPVPAAQSAKPTKATSGKPHWSRGFLGAWADEALKGTGHVGAKTVEAIRGGNGSSSSATKSSVGDADKPTLSTPGSSPVTAQVGAANKLADVEKQVVQIDREMRNWNSYFVGELKAVRKDISSVADVASGAMRIVTKMQKDAQAEAFKKKVKSATFRGKDGRFMSAATAMKDRDVHPADLSKLMSLLGDAELFGEGGLAAGAGFGLKKLYGRFRGAGSALSRAAEIPEGAGAGMRTLGALSKFRRVTGPLGGVIAGGMEYAHSGSVGRSAAVGAGSIGGGWAGAMGGAAIGTAILPGAGTLVGGLIGGIGGGYLGEKLGRKGYDAATGYRDAEPEGDVDEDDVSISSKKSITFKAVEDFTIEARADILIKGRTITLDAEKVIFKAEVEGDSTRAKTTGSSSPPQATPPGRAQQWNPKQEYDPATGMPYPSTGDVQNYDPAARSSPGTISRGGSYTSPGRTGRAAEPASRSDSDVPNGTLAEQRAKFGEELKNNPDLYDKVLRIAANEQGKHPEGTQAVIESMMNRALVRGTNLETQARWHGSERGGYYEMGNMGRGALEDPKHRAVLEESYRRALGGSNISDYATDNASQGLAARERADGTFRYRKDYHGETFFAPGTAETGLARKWDSWQKQVEEAEARAAAGKTPDAIRDRGTKSADGATPVSSDLAYLQQYGGHSTINMKEGAPGAFKLNPEFSARMAAAGRAYEAETGNKPRYGEMDRDEATQAVYWERYQHGGGIAAPPGRSRHQGGEAGDLPDSDFRRWIKKNAGRFGVQSIPNDVPHMQMDRGFTGANFYKPEPDGSGDAVAAKPNGKGTLIAFSGLNGKIDRESAQKLADARGMNLKVFGYGEASRAAAWVKDNPGSPYHVVGFSKGAEGNSTLNPFLKQIKSDGSPMPERLDTVGKYPGSSSADWNGRGTDIVDHDRGMAQLAAMEAGGKQPPAMRASSEDEEYDSIIKNWNKLEKPDVPLPEDLQRIMRSRSAPVAPSSAESPSGPAYPAEDAQRRYGYWDSRAPNIRRGWKPLKPDEDAVTAAVPTPPNLEEAEDPEAGQKLTDSIGVAKPPEQPDADYDPGTGMPYPTVAAPPSAPEAPVAPTEVASDAAGSKEPVRSDTRDSPRGSDVHAQIEAPVNHPESEAPRPGSDGYGDKQHDPDDCGLCAV